VPAIAPIVSYIASQIAPQTTPPPLNSNTTRSLSPSILTSSGSNTFGNNTTGPSWEQNSQIGSLTGQIKGSYHDDIVFKSLVDMSPPTTALQLKLIEQQILTARNNVVSLFAQAKQTYLINHLHTYAKTISTATQYLQHHVLTRQTFLKHQPTLDTLQSLANPHSNFNLSQNLQNPQNPQNTPKYAISTTQSSNLSPFSHLSTLFDSSLLPTSLVPLLAPPLFSDIIQPPTINTQSFLPFQIRNSPLAIASILTARNAALFSTIRLRDCVQHAWIKHPVNVQKVIDREIEKLWNVDPNIHEEGGIDGKHDDQDEKSLTGNQKDGGNDGSLSKTPLFIPQPPLNNQSLTTGKATTVNMTGKNAAKISDEKMSNFDGNSHNPHNPHNSTKKVFDFSAPNEDLFEINSNYKTWLPQHNSLVLLAEEFNRISQWVTSSVLQSGLKHTLHNELSRFIQFKNQCRVFEVLSTPELPLISTPLPPLPPLPSVPSPQSKPSPLKPSTFPSKPSFSNSPSVTPTSLSSRPSSLPQKSSFGDSTPRAGSTTPLSPSTPLTPSLKSNPFILNNAKALPPQRIEPLPPLARAVSAGIGDKVENNVYLNGGVGTVGIVIQHNSLLPSQYNSVNTNNTQNSKDNIILHQYPSGTMLTGPAINNETSSSSSNSTSNSNSTTNNNGISMSMMTDTT
jgi:hypothetical protein